MPAPAPPLFRPSDRESGDDFTVARLRWLVRLRWIACAGIVLAGALSAAGAFPGVAWPVLFGTAAALALYNFVLWRTNRTEEASGRRAAIAQAVIDLASLTVVLWAAGGVRSPFVGYYVFHVALVGILSGPRATLLAGFAALAFAGALALCDSIPALRIGAWRPVPPWDFIADFVAFGTTVGAVAYLVTHAVRELRNRGRALESARDRAALEYEVLSTTLNQLEAGLEVVDADGMVVWRNKRAEELAPRIQSGALGKTTFAVQVEGGERVYEMLVFPLATDGGRARIMNLYVDRTAAMLAEQRLVLAERLASLGRVAQGVAHELNTPLATIRTLAADMRGALKTMTALDDRDARKVLVDDMAESAQLIQDETRRLGRITQALLAGGDLVRTNIDGSVPLAAVVERARALVFAGVRRGPTLEVGPGVDALSVVADADRLVQILVNLLQNAYDAVRDRDEGHVAILARRVDAGVELVVEDDGPGIDPEMEGRLFEPFATTKPPGQGTGLGLYTSYMLVQTMHGALSIERRDESGGTRALVRLPAPARAALERAPLVRAERDQGGAQ